MYRNRDFYYRIFTGRFINGAGHIVQGGRGIDRGKARKMIAENLEHPSFVYEPQNAQDAFRDAYGEDYFSQDELKKIAAEKLNDDKQQLVEIREAGWKQKDRIKNPMRGPMEITDIDGERKIFDVAIGTAMVETEPHEEISLTTYKTKEQFLIANPGFTGKLADNAWKEYAPWAKWNG